MRRLVLLSASLLISAPAFAADLGTYRPGTPYHATQVPTADVCASTCAGDAQCQGWNYVKPSPSASGVCELQSQVGAPVSSPISISGVSRAATPRPSNVVTGATNTIRVGTSVQQRPRPAPRAAATAQRPQPGQRRIVRQPVPQQAAPAPAMHTQPRPGFAPILDGAQPRRAPMGQPRPAAIPQPRMAAPRGPARQRPDARMPRPAAAQPHPQAIMAQHPGHAHAAPMGRPPVGQPIAGPRAPQAAATPGPRPAAAPMPSRGAAQPLTFEQAQASLYGQLHDDVRVPASNAPVPADPGAPIPTAQSRPVAPVTAEPLAGPPLPR